MRMTREWYDYYDKQLKKECSEQALLLMRSARTFPNSLYHNFTHSRTKITVSVYCNLRARVCVTVHYLWYMLICLWVAVYSYKKSEHIRDCKHSLARVTHLGAPCSISSICSMSLSWTQNGWHNGHEECATSTQTCYIRSITPLGGPTEDVLCWFNETILVILS
jgi:hypothetical protein